MEGGQNNTNIQKGIKIRDQQLPPNLQPVCYLKGVWKTDLETTRITSMPY